MRVLHVEDRVVLGRLDHLREVEVERSIGRRVSIMKRTTSLPTSLHDIRKRDERA